MAKVRAPVDADQALRAAPVLNGRTFTGVEQDMQNQSPSEIDKRATQFHARTAAAALAAMEARPEGLTQSEALQRLERHGPNTLPRARQRSLIVRFLAHFHNVLIYVLLGAAIITAALGHFIDTGVILAVVIANAIIGFIQEGRAEQAMESIRQMLAPKSAVLRDGVRCSVDSAEVSTPDQKYITWAE